MIPFSYQTWPWKDSLEVDVAELELNEGLGLDSILFWNFQLVGGMITAIIIHVSRSQWIMLDVIYVFLNLQWLLQACCLWLNPRILYCRKRDRSQVLWFVTKRVGLSANGSSGRLIVLNIIEWWFNSMSAGLFIKETLGQKLHLGRFLCFLCHHGVVHNFQCVRELSSAWIYRVLWPLTIRNILRPLPIYYILVSNGGSNYWSSPG